MSSTSGWDLASVKAQLRTTGQKLGQLQERKDSGGSVTRKDIATLLQQGNVPLARLKAQNLFHQDVMSDVIELVEMHVGTLLERIGELDQNLALAPPVAEAASTVIYAAPLIGSKELTGVRELLIHRLGLEFTRSALGNHDGVVSARVVQASSSPPPSANTLDEYLITIARGYGLSWSPQPGRNDILGRLSEIMDPGGVPHVDLTQLRQLCAQGIPDEPTWLRARVWKLLLGLVSPTKASWKSDITKQRESYYDLVGRLLAPVSQLPDPTSPLSPVDKSLLELSSHLSRVPSGLLAGLSEDPPPIHNGPLVQNAQGEIQVQNANALSSRLDLLRSQSSPTNMYNSPDRSTPKISLTAPRSRATTVVASRGPTLKKIRSNHSDALLRLLYIHKSINAGNLSPNTPSLLIPLYSVLAREVDPDDSAHVEADTFWLLQAILVDFSEAETEATAWMKKLGERLYWADPELSDSLSDNGLNPSMPHYSFHWISALLTHTLPLPGVICAWDAVFARKSREREVNPRLECLTDICAAMLICARTRLLNLGRTGDTTSGLWNQNGDWTAEGLDSTGDAFLEGMSFLQLYSLAAAGGIDRVLQTACDLAIRREMELQSIGTNKPSLTSRIKDSMWKGFTNQPGDSSDSLDNENYIEEEEEEETESYSTDEGNETETPASQSTGFTSRLATTVWRGITNQAPLDPPPSPSPSLDAEDVSAPNSPTSPRPDVSAASTSIWGYAEKLKESDAAAKIAKVSSNWRAKALLAAWGKGDKSQVAPNPSPPKAPHKSTLSEYNTLPPIPKVDSVRRGSLPPMDRSGLYSPPPRPAHFRPPRDSFIFTGPIDVLREQNDGSESDSKRSPPSSWNSLARSRTPQPPPTKSGPRPLLLNSASLMTASGKPRPISRSANSSPPLQIGDWAEVRLHQSRKVYRDSLSSASSLSPSDALHRPPKSRSSDWDSDSAGTSRVVPINRRSISPMAPQAREFHTRPASSSSSTASSDRGLPSPALRSPPAMDQPSSRKQSTNTALSKWGRVELTDPPTRSPPAIVAENQNGRAVRIVYEEDQRVSPAPEPETLELPLNKRSSRRKTPPPQDDTSDSAVETPQISRLAKVRSKKYPSRLSNIQTDDIRATTAAGAKTNALAVEWPIEDQDFSITPKASSFELHDLSSPRSPRPVSPRSPRPARKVTGDGTEEGRKRKPSFESRPRKPTISRSKDSGAEEGDDEGYDDLLSAYESESGSGVSSS